MAEDEARFAGVVSLGVDEHIWRHVDPRRRGPKELLETHQVGEAIASPTADLLI
jgi:hypothetical protein